MPRLRKAQKHVPICALTAHIELSAERVVDGADFDQSLSKPVKKSALFEAISKFQPKDTSVLFNPICSDQAAAAAG